MAIKPPSLWAFQVVQLSQLSTMTNWMSFCHTHSQQASRDCIVWQPRNTCTTDVNNRVRPLETTSYSGLRFKSLFRSFAVDPILMACKFTCTKHNFDTHHSVTDITMITTAIWLHKLWLDLVLTAGRSSITTFVLTWTGDRVCGHLLDSNETLDLRWNCNVLVTTMLYLLYMTCFELCT